MKRKSAFTLVELLVVIAIIAILTAVLFPVFAQARAKARAIACLSNLKQIGAATALYAQDYDDRYPTVERSVFAYGDPQQGDMVVRLQPYLKNYQTFFCPDRATTYPGAAFYAWNPDKRQLGYGSNFGLWSIVDSVGMFQGWPVDYQTCNNCAVGRSLAEVSTPAQFITNGDTFDFPYYSLSLAYQATDGTTTGNIRHQRFWNYVYGDGHAKSILVAPFTTSNNWAFSFTLMPVRLADIKAMCRDESSISSIYSLPCGTMADIIAQYRIEIK